MNKIKVFGLVMGFLFFVCVAKADKPLRDRLLSNDFNEYRNAMGEWMRASSGERMAEIPFLVDKLKTNSRQRAEVALEDVARRDPAAHPLLLSLVTPLMSHSDVNTRYVVRGILSNIGPDAQNSIEWALKSGNPVVRQEAIGAIKQMWKHSALFVPALKADVNDNDPTVRELVILELRSTSEGRKALESLPGGAPAQSAVETRPRVVSDLRPIMPGDPQFLLTDNLRNDDWQIRLKTAQALGQQQPPRLDAVPILRFLFDDKVADVREAAIYAVTAITKDSSYLPEYVAALKDTESKVRRAAVVAIGDLGPAAASEVHTLIDLNDTYPYESRSYVALQNAIAPQIEQALNKIGTPEALSTASKIHAQISVRGGDPSASIRRMQENNDIAEVKAATSFVQRGVTFILFLLGASFIFHLFRWLLRND